MECINMPNERTVEGSVQKPVYARAKHAAEHFKVSKSTLWAWVKRPGFPKPKRASPKVTLFDVAAIERFIEAQQAA
jgi:predicted DNA-binding transcriptional regulator AlpA